MLKENNEFNELKDVIQIFLKFILLISITQNYQEE